VVTIWSVQPQPVCWMYLIIARFVTNGVAKLGREDRERWSRGGGRGCGEGVPAQRVKPMTSIPLPHKKSRGLITLDRIFFAEGHQNTLNPVCKCQENNPKPSLGIKVKCHANARTELQKARNHRSHAKPHWGWADQWEGNHNLTLFERVERITVFKCGCKLAYCQNGLRI